MLEAEFCNSTVEEILRQHLEVSVGALRGTWPVQFFLEKNLSSDFKLSAFVAIYTAVLLVNWKEEQNFSFTSLQGSN